MQLLTHSRQAAFKACRHRHYWAYEVGIRREIDAKALRMGSAYHVGLDALKREPTEKAVEASRSCYDAHPESIPDDEWQMERETVAALVAGYAWRWGNAPLGVVSSEQVFELSITNPETGGASTVFHLAGKIDGLVRLEDGRLAVLEHKLLGEDLGDDSDFWRRLQLDHQITLYVHAARQLGHDVSAVLYDVARKPAIKPTAVPVLDDLGMKIVLDAAGNRVQTEKKLWRQTGDTAKGYTLQTRPMLPDEWTAKLTEDIGQRPEWYYVRREIARLDQDIDECLAELWEIQQTIREAQRKGRWFRTVSRDSCPWCPYFDLCASKWSAEAPGGSMAPEGFVIVEEIHPELRTEVS